MPDDLRLSEIFPAPQDAIRYLHIVKAAAKDEAGHEWTKEEAKNVQFWMKQLVALVLGILLPLAGIKGWLGFATSILVMFSITTSLKHRLHIPDDIMETSESFNEGLAQCSQLFLLSWISTHTIVAA